MQTKSLTFAAMLAASLLAGCAQAAPPVTSANPSKSVPYVWRNVQIVGGGFIPGIEFSPKQPGLIYARTDIGGAYRWDPITHQWTPLIDWAGQDDSNLFGIESIGVDPTDARRVYLAAGTYTQSWAGNGAILRSIDQGRHWQRTAMPFKMGGNEDGRSVGERLVVDPNQNKILFFGSRNDGLWRSINYGATWSKVNSFPITGRTNGVGIAFVIFDPRTGRPAQPTRSIYIGVAAPGTATLYHSGDGGVTWAAVANQPPDLLPHHGVLDKTGILYLTYGDAPGPNGMSNGAVWKHDTNTQAWTDITPVKPGTPGEGNFGYAGLTVDAQHPGTVMVSSMDKWSTGDDIFRTTDGGGHWTRLKPTGVRDSSLAPFLNLTDKTPALGHWIGTLEIDPFHPGHVLYGTGATMWGSDDATAIDSGQPSHWTVWAKGLEETAVIDLISPPAGAHLISALGDIGGFRHDNLSISPPGGIRQNPVMNTVTGIDFAELSPNLVVRVGNGDRHGAISQDGGTTWTPFAAEPPGSRSGGTIAISSDGKTLLWTLDRTGAFYSHDSGATWTASTGLPARLHPLADRANPQVFYACDGGAGKLYASTDGGATFTATAASFPTGDAHLHAVPGHAGDLWLTTGNHGLYHSTDGGATLTQVPSVARGDALGFGKAAPGQSYPALYLTGTIGGVQGIFRSDDIGATWVRINDNQHQYGWIGQTVLGDPRVYGRVYLGTNGRGILYADPVPGQK